MPRFSQSGDGDVGKTFQERLSIAFGTEAAPWDFERVLERYELLYEAEMSV